MNDNQEDIVKNHVAQLMEHFDTVQIFVSKHESDIDGTYTCQYGGGNFFARYGQINHWIIVNEQETADE